MTTTTINDGFQPEAAPLHLSPDTHLFAAGLVRIAARIAQRASRAGRSGHPAVISLCDLEGAAFDDHVDSAFDRLEQGLR
jgi:hypothetical protein